MRALPLTAMLLAAPAAAETLKAVPAALDPALAYVLVEYQQTPNTLTDLPGDKDYLALNEGLTLARYDAERRDVRGLGRAADRPVPGKGSAMEPFRRRPIAKREGRQMMLLALSPDTYVLQGWGTTSFSLGSLSFRAEPGVVTDLGVVQGLPDHAPGEAPKVLTTGRLLKSALIGFGGPKKAVYPMRVTLRPRAAGDLPLPAGLVPAQVRPVVFERGATFGNYLGGTVNRIEGVNVGAASTER